MPARTLDFEGGCIVRNHKVISHEASCELGLLRLDCGHVF